MKNNNLQPFPRCEIIFRKKKRKELLIETLIESDKFPETFAVLRFRWFYFLNWMEKFISGCEKN
jgi:hypothetical protein